MSTRTEWSRHWSEFHRRDDMVATCNGEGNHDGNADMLYGLCVGVQISSYSMYYYIADAVQISGGSLDIGDQF